MTWQRNKTIPKFHAPLQQNNQEKTPSPQLHSDRQPKKTKSKIYRAITSRTNINKTFGNPQISQRGSAGYGLAHRRGSRRKRKGAVLSYCPLLLFEQDLAVRQTSPAGSRYNCLKKSFPLSSTRMKAGKSTTSIFQIASMPNSGYSSNSTFLMFSFAKRAAGPPIEPR